MRNVFGLRYQESEPWVVDDPKPTVLRPPFAVDLGPVGSPGLSGSADTGVDAVPDLVWQSHQ